MGRAALDGVIGAIAVTGLQWFDGGPGLGAITWAAPVFADAWLVALTLYILVGAIFGVIYGLIFARLGRASWATGIGLGAIHGVLALALLGTVVAVFDIADVRLLSYAWVLVLHLVYGAVVGALGKLVLHHPDPARA